MKSWPAVALSIALLSVCAGCLAPPQEEDIIRQVKKNPAQFKGKEITVTGMCKEILDFGQGQSGFMLGTPGGSVPVKPLDRTPPTMEQVKLRAVVETDYQIGDSREEVILIVKEIIKMTGKGGKGKK